MALQDARVRLALVLRGTPEMDRARRVAGAVAVLASRVTMEKINSEYDELPAGRTIGGVEPGLT